MKKWHLIFICIFIVILILGFAVTVYILKTPSPDLPTNANFFDKVFNFLDEWASAGAPAMMLLAAAIALSIGLAGIWENRRQRIEERHRQALERIRIWAEESFDAVARPITQQQLSHRLTELVVSLRPSIVKSIGILYDAERLGGCLDTKVLSANFILNKFISRLMGKEEIYSFKTRFEVEDTITPIANKRDLEDSKRELLDALKEVVNSSTERLVPKDRG